METPRPLTSQRAWPHATSEFCGAGAFLQGRVDDPGRKSKILGIPWGLKSFPMMSHGGFHMWDNVCQFPGFLILVDFLKMVIQLIVKTLGGWVLMVDM